MLSRSSIGESVELVDGDFDDDNDDDVDEQSNGKDIRDFADNLLCIKRAVNTSSSSISESDELDAEFGGSGSNWPAARKFCSNSSSCPIKFKFGDIIGRASLTNLYASSNDNDLYRIT